MRHISLLFTFLVLLSCARERTEIVLGLASTRPFPCSVDSYALEVVEPAGTRTLVSVRSWTASPLSATLTPDSGMSTRVRLIAYLAGAEVGAAEATLVFRAGESLYFPLVISDSDGCFPGRCELPAERARPFMDDLPEDPTTPTCSTSSDAGPPDVAFDGCEPAAEMCNGVNDDCDGQVDEDASCEDALICLGGECVPPVTGYTVAEASELERFADSCTWPNPEETFFVPSGEPEEQFLLGDFDFSFLGSPVDSIWVGENGYVTFGERVPLSFLREPQNPESCEAIRPAVYAFWEDLTTEGAAVCAGFSGAEGNRRLEITWSGVCFSSDCASSSTRLSFSIVLEEGTDKIYFLYGELQGDVTNRARGLSASIGLSAHAPGECDTCTDHTRCLLSNSISHRMAGNLINRVFTPIPAD
ncbi:MAG: hypothetical protein ACI9KE_002300 [Polyangiales bacterium]|jgi:hypothetical protein